jgi:BirA family biotin operon repressor/biotin-[acetyl-CoA-carboxylase] ligase
MLNPVILKKRLKHEIFLNIFREVASTNDEAKRFAAENAGRYALYAADRQTSGRGRRGHSFYSPDGGLYMTLSLPVKGSQESVQRLTCAAAVAVCGAIRTLTGLSPAVKWVNDIYVQGRKVAGILAELATDLHNRPLAVIIGVGVNLTTKCFPEEFAARAGSIGDIDPNALCAAIADRLIDACEDVNIHAVMDEYRALNFCLGKEIVYTDNSGEHHAVAVDIAPDGSLVIDENGDKKTLNSGEISVAVT